MEDECSFTMINGLNATLHPSESHETKRLLNGCAANGSRRITDRIKKAGKVLFVVEVEVANARVFLLYDCELHSYLWTRTGLSETSLMFMEYTLSQSVFTAYDNRLFSGKAKDFMVNAILHKLNPAMAALMSSEP